MAVALVLGLGVVLGGVGACGYLDVERPGPPAPCSTNEPAGAPPRPSAAPAPQPAPTSPPGPPPAFSP
ncbi:MAG TPA: hypothetical protein VH044_12905 [Polyangiaceae bacterium]|nr:hypothetical protein [Polyangiaceae bacterium]